MSDLHSNRFTVFICALAIVGWMIAFAGLCASRTFVDKVSWWIATFDLLVVGIACSVLWTSSVRIYYPVVLTLIAISIPYNTNEIISYISIRKPSLMATVSGYIILTIVKFFWIVVFGVQQEESVLRSFSNLPYNQRFSTTSKECTSKVVFGHTASSRSSPPPNMINHPSPTHDRMVSVPVYMNTTASSVENDTVYMRPNVEYNIPVTALHTYQGNTNDPNELSFTKDEVLFVYERIGTWWQAKKSSGEIGMIPSNYVVGNAA
ncbi:hypothetical protein K501DRAFT_297547 [Backusella circina FSU 941]|nr:hypothetical protein K501DRAFT_297547 [Backusella circina FSU 941]